MDIPPVNALNLVTRPGQAQWLHMEAQRAQLQDQAQYFAALQGLLREPNFDVVLRHWFQALFLEQDVDRERSPQELVDQRFFWRIFRDLRAAGAMERQLVRRGETG